MNGRGRWTMDHWHGTGRLRTWNAKIDNQRRNFFQCGLGGEVGRNVLQLRQSISLRVRRPSCRGGDRGIFRFDPAQKRPALVRIRSDQVYARRRWQESDGRWINNLENV